MEKIDQDTIRDFVLKHYTEQEKEAIRKLLKMEKTLTTLQWEKGELLSDLYQNFRDQARAKAIEIQAEVSHRVLASVNIEILDLLEKEE